MTSKEYLRQAYRLDHRINSDIEDEDVMKALRKKERTQNALIDAVKANLGASL